MNRQMSRNVLIAGIDPGSTSAVAAFNLEKELVLLKSQRDMRDADIIRELVDHGKPVVIASDKAKTPSKVDRIAGKLGARRFEPETDLERTRKYKLGEGDNSHEIDAVAAARNAFNNMHRTINKVVEKSADSEDRVEIAEKYLVERQNPGGWG